MYELSVVHNVGVHEHARYVVVYRALWVNIVCSISLTLFRYTPALRNNWFAEYPVNNAYNLIKSPGNPI